MKERPHSILDVATIVALCITLILMLTLLGKELSDTLSRAPERHFSLFGLQPTPPTIDTIQSWMTFDYLDHVFKLPSTYFKTDLGITDTRYPRMSLTRFSTDKGISAAAAVLRVQNALRGYEATSTTSP